MLWISNCMPTIDTRHHSQLNSLPDKLQTIWLRTVPASTTHSLFGKLFRKCVNRSRRHTHTHSHTHPASILNNKFSHTADIAFDGWFGSVSRSLFMQKREKKKENIIQSLWWWLREVCGLCVCVSVRRLFGFYWRHLNKFIFVDKSRSTNLIYFSRLFTLCFRSVDPTSSLCLAFVRHSSDFFSRFSFFTFFRLKIVGR